MGKKPKKEKAEAALGFFYVASDDLHAEAILKSVDDKGDFSDGVLVSRVTVARIDLVLVFVRGAEYEWVKYAALASPVPRGGGTGKQGVRLSEVVSIELPLEGVRQNVPAPIWEELEPLLYHDAERPSPPCWDTTWAAIKALVPADRREEMERLERRRNAPTFDFSQSTADKVYCQKDAVSVALEVAGINRKPIFASLSDGLAAGKTLLGSAIGSLKERVVIQHDVRHVPDFLKKYDHGDHCVFEQGNRRLTVYNVDFNPGEIGTGCDLIYFNHNYGSYTFVQYKLMDDENGTPIYRPKQQCFDEINRMKALLAFLDGKKRDATRLDNFRLVPNPFFLKLCRRERLLIDMPELTRGMYLNLDFWDRLSQDSRCKGPQGGLRVTFDAADRWLCRTEFAPLVGEGWVGTYDLTEGELSTYIEKAVEQHRSVMFAKSSGERQRRQG